MCGIVLTFPVTGSPQTRKALVIAASKEFCAWRTCLKILKNKKCLTKNILKNLIFDQNWTRLFAESNVTENKKYEKKKQRFQTCKVVKSLKSQRKRKAICFKNRLKIKPDRANRRTSFQNIRFPRVNRNSVKSDHSTRCHIFANYKLTKEIL